MTNTKAYQGFHDDKKVEEHCCNRCNSTSFWYKWKRVNWLVLKFLQCGPLTKS